MKIEKSTLDTIHLILRNQTNLDEETINNAISVLEGKKIAIDRNIGQSNDLNLEKPMKAEEAAKLLGLTKKGVAYHAKQGRIRVVRADNGNRSLGYVASDIRKLLKGRTLE